jgi:steroid delta-isomerase-like uncharacterized protein
MAQENSALIRRWFEEVWNNGRMAAIDEMASPDVVGHGQAQHDTVIGREQFRTFAGEFRRAFPDLKVKIDHIVEQGDKVAARWTATMTHQGEFLGFAPTGKKATITGTSIQRFSDGKIVEGWDNWDQLGLLVQIGAVPAAHFVPPAERRSA